jgi:hypothetical protein
MEGTWYFLVTLDLSISHLDHSAYRLDHYPVTFLCQAQGQDRAQVPAQAQELVQAQGPVQVQGPVQAQDLVRESAQVLVLV